MGQSRKQSVIAGMALWLSACGFVVAQDGGEPLTEKPATETPAAPKSQPLEEPPPSTPATDAKSGPHEVVVTLRDGQRYAGELVSRDESGIVLRIAGIETRLRSSQIERVQVVPSAYERYRQMREAIEPTDVESLLRLAQWLRTKAMWDEGLDEVERALAVQPDHPQALELKVILESQRELARRAGQGTRPPPSKASDSGKKIDNFPLLSERDINVIKVYEVDLSDPPRMFVDRETIKAFIAAYENDPLMPRTKEGREALYGWSPARLLDLMFRMQAREFYERVRVIDSPRSMKLFRDRVHGAWLINACATTRCHGGSEAGRLMLATDKKGSDATVYTNFLILDRYRLRDGRPLINYEEPAKSVLLQMALARERSSVKHPEVPGMQGNSDLFRPAFRQESDTRFQDAVEWIKSMYRPRPEYPVVYTPPGPEAVPVDPKAPPVPR